MCPAVHAVEEYVGKGDILNDCISHPDKYTERHVAVALARPLLQALAHLHANNIIHRCAPCQQQCMMRDRVPLMSRLFLLHSRLQAGSVSPVSCCPPPCAPPSLLPAPFCFLV